MSKRVSAMDRWLDEQIVAAGRISARSSDRTVHAVYAARMAALAQVRARVWRFQEEPEDHEPA